MNSVDSYHSKVQSQVKYVDIDTHEKFNCKPRSIEVSWSRCVDNYVAATAFGDIRGPKEDERWDSNCYRCAIGKAIREKYVSGELPRDKKSGR